MSADWPLVKLGEHCSKIGSGATPKGGSNVYLDKGEIFLIRSQNIYNNGFKPDGLVYITEDSADKLNNVIIEKDDILLNITGDSVARVCLAKAEYLPARVNQHVAIIRPKPAEFDTRFLKYFLASPKMQNLLLVIASAGATRNALTKGMIESLEVPKPPLEVQTSIADNLSSLDDKIELNNQINQTLEAMAQAIFKSWFVDFEPVKAKISAIEAGEDADGVTRAAMSAISGKTDEELDQLQAEQPEHYTQLKNTAEFFPADMQDSELGEIPEGWEIKKLSEFGKFICGKTPPKKEIQYYENGEFPFIKIPDMRNQIFPVKTEDKLSKNGAELISKKKLPPFSVCVSCIATVGMICITYEDSYTNQQINSIVPNEYFSPYYLYFEMEGLNDKLHSWASGGSATLNLNTNEFSKLKIISPSREIVHNFSNKVDPLFKKILSNSLEKESLSNLRDSLLPKLLSGELSVDAAGFAEEN